MMPDLIKMQKMTQTIITQNVNPHTDDQTVIEDMAFSRFIAQDYIGKRKLGNSMHVILICHRSSAEKSL